MSSPEYRAYLGSPEWDAVRKQHRQPRCAACGSSDKLHVHHLHYRTLKHEQARDLVTLCDLCHGIVHELHRVVRPRMSLANVTQRWIQTQQAKRRIQPNGRCRKCGSTPETRAAKPTFGLCRVCTREGQAAPAGAISA